MGILGIIIFVVLVVLVIIISTQELTIKKLNKANAANMRAVTSYKAREQTSIDQLKGYIQQNPLDAYQLLIAHVNTVEERKKKDR